MKKISFFILTRSLGTYINIISWFSIQKATAKAYKLFSHPRKGRLDSAALPKFLAQSVQEKLYLNQNEIQTYYWEAGKNVVLLVHGWESNSSRWEDLVVLLLKNNYSVVAFDGPAHGLSSGKEFNMLVYAEFINEVAVHFNASILVGHSLGGKACLYYQSIFQNISIKKIISLGSPSDFRIILKNYILILRLRTKVYEHLEIYFKNQFNITLDTFSAHHFASELQVEGLVVHDVDDKIVLFREGEKINNNWKNATLMDTKGLGHSLHHDLIYKEILKFIND